MKTSIFKQNNALKTRDSRDSRAILITGTAGFIGFHLAKSLISRGERVFGLDNINSYYDISLKNARLAQLGIDAQDLEYGKLAQGVENFSFIKLDLCDKAGLDALFSAHKFTHIVHLAAQAGVRYSLISPQSYAQSNLVGFANIIECAKNAQIAHFIYASSSSVYGGNKKTPFSENYATARPLSLYAATKIANEAIAHSYAHCFNLKTTGLRFFTVYGEFGRPDMAAFIFTRAILNNEPICVFNNGKSKRDFTYINDCVRAIVAVLDAPKCAHNIYNIGSNAPINLMDFIETLESLLNKKALKDFQTLQNGDMAQTFADMTRFKNDFGFAPKTPLRDGLKRFVAWYREFYG